MSNGNFSVQYPYTFSTELDSAENDGMRSQRRIMEKVFSLYEVRQSTLTRLQECNLSYKKKELEIGAIESHLSFIDGSIAEVDEMLSHALKAI